jgi:hypothetical protein
MTFRMRRDEQARMWAQGTRTTLAIWGLLAAIRATVALVSQHVNPTSFAAAGDLPLLFGVTLGAQNMELTMRRPLLRTIGSAAAAVAIARSTVPLSIGIYTRASRSGADVHHLVSADP